MSACLRDSQILQLVFGVTLETELKEVMEHLETCPACRQRLESERAQHSSAQNQPRDLDSTTSSTGPSDSSQFSDSSLGALPTIDGYDILSRIHAGAQGVVYKAVQLSTSRTVAVKLLPHEHSATDRQKHRFEREVGLAASLRHPNIVTVYDSGLTSGRYFFAMEYIHGKPLDQYLKSANLNVPDKLRLFATICSAVSYAHQKGVIHRDLKPGNILVDAAAQPHVVDFGLAKSAGVVAMHGDAPFTLTSQFMGTLAYASPEQTKGDPTLIDTRSDIYSLGVILFEMLTGTYPYPMNADLAKMFHTICHTPPKPPSAITTGINQDIDTIVLRSLAKEPDRRYQTVADLQADVERWLTGEPISARRDSLMYLLRMETRKWRVRHRSIIFFTIVAGSAVVSFFASSAIYRAWSWPFDRYEHILASTFAPPSYGVPFDNIRLIAIDDETVRQVGSIAANEALQGVSSDPSNWRSMRRLHGRLMQRLAQHARPSSVVWDISFPHPTSADDRTRVAPFNNDFIDGVRALQAIGITPVVAVHDWEPKTRPTSSISADFLEAGVQRGGYSFMFSRHAPWRVTLVVKRGTGMRFPALSLVGYAEATHPMQDFVVDLDETSETMSLRFHPRNTKERDPAIEESVPLGISYVAPFRPNKQDDSEIDLQLNDILAWLVVRLPTDDEIKQITVPYHEVFRASGHELDEWFTNKIVLIGDLRSAPAGRDWRIAPDGRQLSGLHAHAAAIDGLVRRNVVMRFPNNFAFGSTLALGAFIGGAIVWIAPRSRQTRIVALMLSLVIGFAVSVLVYRFTAYVCNPFYPMIALILSFCGAAFLVSSPNIASSFETSHGDTAHGSA